MTREEAVKRIKEIQKLYVFTPTINEALDLAIEALKGDLHCPKCGTIVRDGRQYYDLVYRGLVSTCKLKKDHVFLNREGEKVSKEQKSGLDLISRQQAIEAMCEECIHGGYDTCYVDCTEVAVLHDLPPVTPKEMTLEEWQELDREIRGDAESATTTDCISRADAIAYIDRITNSGLGKNKSLDYLRKYISALPSVMPDFETFCGVPIKEAIEVLEKYKHSPTERTGEWVSHELWDMPWFTCSECNYHGRSDFKFCPNCGAKMGGDTE